MINALTPLHHPCQALADLLTIRERFGELEGVKVAYVGDGNNVARSLAIVGRTAGVEVRVATPPGYALEPGLAALDTNDVREAATGADVLYTDVWVSMGDDEDEAATRRDDLAFYQLNEDLLEVASDRAIFMHCLPAHPGRGDLRGGALRRAVGRLGPGGEPAARSEGADGAACRQSDVRPRGEARRAISDQSRDIGPAAVRILVTDAEALDARHLVPPGGDAECAYARRVDGNLSYPGVEELDPDRLSERIAARLHLAPRFRQVVAPVPLGEPMWRIRVGRHRARSGTASGWAAFSLSSSTAQSLFGRSSSSPGGLLQWGCAAALDGAAARLPQGARGASRSKPPDVQPRGLERARASDPAVRSRRRGRHSTSPPTSTHLRCLTRASSAAFRHSGR